MSKDDEMEPRPFISGSLFLVAGDDDHGHESTYRVTIDSEQADVFQVHLNPAADAEETGEMSATLYVNAHNATALRDELTRHIEWWQANGSDGAALGRWAAFTDDEIESLSYGIAHGSADDEAVLNEVFAEANRRNQANGGEG